MIEPSPELIQQARDIVADMYVKQESVGTQRPCHFPTVQDWARHIDEWANYMRGGAYDDDLAVQATLVALQSAQVPA